uniref:DDE Tnp4 domain-containing protein n=1 Tax=Ditylenchus dipsaci TaxID=166011 RepID=A0A915D632_9BILA
MENFELEEAIAFGPTYSAVAPLFVIGDSTVHDICKEVSEAIATAMQTEYLPTPTRQTWERSAEGFNQLRQFPKTLGAIDGKHIAIVKPEHSGAAFFNYKKFYSIVLLAIADAESRFLMVDVGASGRNSDSTLWISSPLRNFLESPEAALPPNEEGTIEARPETARLYTLAAVILHNFLRDPVEEEDLNLRFPDDRRMLIDQRATEAGRQKRLIRDRFVDVVIRGVQDVV